MKITNLYVFLLFAIVGCKQSPLSQVQQVVEAQTKLLVDSGYIENKYVVLYELGISDSNHIYSVADSEFPVDATLELPSKIVKYKDKYLCFVELDEPEMLIDEMEKNAHYYGNPMVDTKYLVKFLIGVSKSGQKKVLIGAPSGEDTHFYDITELWPYFSGYVEDCPVQMGIVSHDARIYSGQTFNVDSIRQQLLAGTKNIYGEMYLKNNTDSVVCLSSSTKKHYAIINNQDTLYLSLCDSLPITLGPHESTVIQYESIPNRKFYKKMALEKDPWGYFYNLFCESTYSFMKINQEDLKTRVMFWGSTYFYGFEVTNEEGERLFHILNHGIYDKEERRMRNTKFWWDKLTDK
ncbi:Imm65 family immunity protein [Bacteroides sp.]|uniref:Imm65 family immunity protein n=1 Tax=Bacteroides sp. TaxID=29523 RepID=UPI0025C4F501|nr:Imm65 family immunity protein [Bacteroides sp.]